MGLCPEQVQLGRLRIVFDIQNFQDQAAAARPAAGARPAGTAAIALANGVERYRADTSKRLVELEAIAKNFGHSRFALVPGRSRRLCCGSAHELSLFMLTP